MLPAPASANALALLRFPDRRTAWVVVAGATLAAPAGQLQDRLESLHQAVPMTGARLHGETWHPGPPPEPLIVDGDPLHAQDLLDRFDLAADPPLRVAVGSAGTRLAVACHHAAFDGLSLVALLASLTGGVDNPTPPAPRSATLPHRGLRFRRVRLRHAWIRAGTPAGAATTRAAAGWWREVGTATAGLLALFLLANVDVLLARHYLDRAAAGRYALGAVVAKIAFWAPQFVVTVIFPRLVGAADPRRLVAGSAVVIAGFGVLLGGGLAVADRLGLAVPVLGGGYAGLGPLLPLFAALGTALALVQLLLFEGIAARDRRMGRAVVAALVAEVALVAGPLHGSVGQIAGTALATALALAAAGWWLLRRRPGLPIPGGPVTTASAPGASAGTAQRP